MTKIKYKRKPHSEETKKKISEAHKGIKLSQKHKENISKAHKGKKLTKEHISKILESRKGFKHTEETKDKISKAHKGKIISLETRKRMSKAQKGNQIWLGKKHTEKSIKKMRLVKLGIKPSIENRKKRSNSLKGDKCYNWKGGINEVNDTIRKTLEYKLWREKVFERDNWTCQKYKIKGGKLHSHHIKNFAQYPKLRFIKSNGITLSDKAHKQFHKKYGIKNNTKEQLLEFLMV